MFLTPEDQARDFEEIEGENYDCFMGAGDCVSLRDEFKPRFEFTAVCNSTVRFKRIFHQPLDSFEFSEVAVVQSGLVHIVMQT